MKLNLVYDGRHGPYEKTGFEINAESIRAWHSTRRGQRIPMAALFRPKTVGTAETIFPGYKSSGRTVCDPGQHTSQ